ncbi:hypothetical protein V1639_04525 [Pseudarthrobacter sp. J75]|uniref:hypothetical protein n=1 Tax=unclassified Pseudarthrobacter TaxID=2647000 RepID=UPI002E81FFD9|nr:MULTISPECIES: hypothetical protein [unclassified Pseudarthrobacter]MEE2523933.1 hypothetical protein [Pseudarthrobacter sp. J47]MEE2528298.1 hypothetical protein [Pseudarthrobacter sp. J75]MEE2568001.1 hypothetical protein [Pseudarthrobacter sp. J64]
MGVSRRLLFGSTLWQVARPATTLTPGHLTIRLSDPAVAFDSSSAADWLRCYRAAHAALSEVFAARTFCLFFAHQWHPFGAALAEPEAESSTPTFHLFGRFSGESTTPGQQLALPAHRRVPLTAVELQKYDGGLRRALQRAAAIRGTDGPSNTGTPFTGASADVPPSTSLITRTEPDPPAGPHHTVLSPGRGVSSVGALLPEELLAMAAALQQTADLGTVNGLSCVVAEGPDTGQLELHAVARSAGEAFNPLARLLDSPKVSQALL